MKRPWLMGLLLVMIVSIIVPASLAFARSRRIAEVLPQPPTAGQIEAKYIAAGTGGQKVRILIVPGHEPGFGGTVYQGVYEREITVEMADQLSAYLNQNPRLDVIVARSDTTWDDELQDYFDTSWNNIQDFVTDKKEDFKKLIKKGKVTARSSDDQVDHDAASNDVALRLYGISRWADENNVDLMVHLHINDTTDHGPNDPSANSGFAVYVPDEQYGNADTSKALGATIASRLAAMNATSTLPIESKGIVPDQELIALGAYNTLSVPSVLIEYAYITEPKFTHPEVRGTVTKDFAYETYLGIQDFLHDPIVVKYPSASLPYDFVATSSIAIGKSSQEAYALQAALHTLGFFPPATTTAKTATSSASTAPQTLSDCPVSGLMGPCTVNAISSFQSAHGLSQTGMLGPKTLAILNAIFGTNPIPVLSTTLPASQSASCSLPTLPISKLGQQDTKANGDITKLQTIFATDSSVYPEKIITGYYGPVTQKAVQRFQVQQGIAKAGEAGYGLVGPKTLAALKSLCK